MTQLFIQVDPRQQAELMREFRDKPAQIKLILFSATKRTTREAKTEASRIIRQVLNLKKERVDRDLSTRTIERTDGAITGHLEVKATTPRFITFGARESFGRGRRAAAARPAGIRVKVRKDQPAVLFRHAFIATGRGGTPMVFERAMRGGGRVGRKPIVGLYGPSPAGILRGEGQQRLDDLEQSLGQKLHKNVDSQIRRALQRRRAQMAREAA